MYVSHFPTYKKSCKTHKKTLPFLSYTSFLLLIVLNQKFFVSSDRSHIEFLSVYFIIINIWYLSPEFMVLKNLKESTDIHTQRHTHTSV